MQSLSASLAWGDVAAAATAVLAVCGVVGLVVRFVLVPYLRTELAPTREVAHQLTGRSRPHEDPTVREELQEVRRLVDEHAEQLDRAAIEVRSMARAFDGHLDWSQEEVDRLWAELNRQRAAGLRPDSYKHRRDTQ